MQKFIRKIAGITLAFLLMLYLGASQSKTPGAPKISPFLIPLPAFSAKDLAVIVNDSDRLSVQIADYYRKHRHIPDSQMIHVRFDPSQAVIPEATFNKLKSQIDKKTPKHVQIYALTWIQPFRVECMSITSALAFGFDKAYCAEGCVQTRHSPYFASDSSKPFSDYNIRPTMTVAAKTLDDAKKLIDRGVASDFTHPQGTGYLLKTSDNARSSRAVLFPEVAEKINPVWPVRYLEQDFIENQKDVMFYFTGLTHVPHLHDNVYLPGAVADHLTSAGGIFTSNSQMDILEWIKAGATASYGTVVEPCNFPAKFSHPGVLMFNYLRGSSLIEAYWKSVRQPGQGIFVGEPLAKPYAYPAKK